MGLIYECPECGIRCSTKNSKCGKCGINIKKAAYKTYWIEFYLDGKRKRERIGTSKQAAEQRLREVLTLRTEGRYINKNKNAVLTFDKLAAWYLELSQIKAKRSYDRDKFSIAHLKRFFTGKKISYLTKSRVEDYRCQRLKEDSYRKKKTAPATVNREIACLKHMLNLAKQENKIDAQPFEGLKKLKENNERNRILSPEEYKKLLSHCPPHTAQIVKMAYYTSMRQGEILNLKWNRVDLKEGVIRLLPEDTKTDEGRIVPLHPEVVKMLKSMPRTVHNKVFTLDGRPLTEIKHSFTTACKDANINDFRFHDLRHTAINNWRLQGHDFFRIMAASGHKTMSVFKRYNTVTEDEVKLLVKE